MPREGAGLKILLTKLAHEITNVHDANGPERHLAAFRIGHELCQVTTVAGDCVCGKALLHANIIQEAGKLGVCIALNGRMRAGCFFPRLFHGTGYGTSFAGRALKAIFVNEPFVEHESMKSQKPEFNACI